ncbi:kelch-like protein 11 [Glandiceps talaboti]
MSRSRVSMYDGEVDGLSLGANAHCVRFTERLKNQRDDGQYCDMTVIVQGRQFKAHRCVLAAFIPYFESMLRSNFKEAQSGRVELMCTTAEGMEAILRFVYTGKISLTVDNVYDVIKGADHMLMMELKDICGKFLEKQLEKHLPSVEVNCFEVREFAEMHNLPRLQDVAQKTIECRLCKMLTEPENYLYDLSNDELSGLLANEKIKVKETELLQFLIKWTRCDQKRKAKFPELFSHIRLHDVDKRILARYLEEEEFMQNKRCRDLVQNVLNNKSRTEEQEGTGKQEGATKQTSRPGRLVDMVVVSGGDHFSRRRCYNLNEEFIFGYVIDEDSWFKLTNVPCFDFTKVTTTDNVMFLYNGLNVEYGNSFDRQDAFSYDLVSNNWKDMPITEVPHSNGITVVCNKRLYSLGALTSSDDQTTFASFDFESNHWESKSAMPHGHVDGAVAILDDRYIYAIGGKHGGREGLYIDCYDCRIDEWETKLQDSDYFQKLKNDPNIQIWPPLVIYTPDGLEITSLGKFKLVVSKQSSTIRLEDSNTSKIPDENFDRDSPAVCHIRGDIFVSGGQIEDDFCSEVVRREHGISSYIYKSSSGTWNEIAPAPLPCEGAKCALVEIPHEYLGSEWVRVGQGGRLI